MLDLPWFEPNLHNMLSVILLLEKNLFSVSHWKNVLQPRFNASFRLGPSKSHSRLAAQPSPPLTELLTHSLQHTKYVITPRVRSHCPLCLYGFPAVAHLLAFRKPVQIWSLLKTPSWHPPGCSADWAGFGIPITLRLTSSGSLPWHLSHLFPTFLTRACVLWRKKCLFVQVCSFITCLASWLRNACQRNINGGGGFKK